MSVVMVFVSIAAFETGAGAETVASLKDKQSEIQEKIDKNEEELKKLEKEKDAKEKIVSELNKQLSNLSDEYDVVRARKSTVEGEIVATEKRISALTDEIAEKDEEINNTVQLFCERLRANYVAGETTTLSLLTSSSSISVFLNRLELLKRVTDNDQNLVDKLNKEIEELNEAKQELETEKQELVVRQNQLAAVQADIKSTLNKIESKSAEVERRLKEIQSAATGLEDDIAAYSADEKKIQKEINKILAAQAAAARKKQQQNGGGASPTGGGRINPTTGFQFPIQYSGAYLSSGFGYRSASISGNAFHGGIDIAGGNIYGQPVYASRAGTVIIAEHYSNSGYGHYVMIDHGDGYQTLYGHCSSVVVNVGQYVNQGQLIAYVGSTGNSTGPHLHFEVRYNGEKLNPLNYVSF